MFSPNNDTNMDTFNSLYPPYLNTEYIPPNLVPIVLLRYFSSMQILHKYTENNSHLLIKVNVREFLDGPLKKWAHNRPPDLARCPDIARGIFSAKKPIDSLFYIGYNNITQTFDILDGIHRVTALKIIKKENELPINLMDPNDFGGNNDATWLWTSDVLINIRFNNSIGELIETFQRLNRSNPVPDLYISNNSHTKKTIIEDIVTEYYARYRSHFSSSINPNVPNINREQFIDILDKLYDKYKITEDNAHKLSELLEGLNCYIQNNIPRKTTQKTLDKCKETGCYLFLYRIDRILSNI